MLILAILPIIILSSGCISNNSPQPPCPDCTVTPTPNIAAVDLQKKGSDAYIKGDYASSLDYYDKSLAADPKYIQTWMAKGDLLMRMNRTAEAVTAYDSALALDSSIPWLWNNRGKALMEIGNYSAARDSFDRALRLAPDYIEAKENRNLTLQKLK